MKHGGKITPSYEACKNFVCNILPGIMLDLQKKGNLPKEYMTGTGREEVLSASNKQ